MPLRFRKARGVASTRKPRYTEAVMKVARVIAATLLLGVPLSACNNADELPPAGSFASVQGNVVDAVTHKPIPNATVVIDTVLTQKTDAQGNFKFEKVPSGILDYVVKAPGYPDLTSSSNADPGKPFILNVSMTAPQSRP